MNIVEPIKSTETLREIESYLGRGRKKRHKRDLLLFVMGTNTGLRVSDILALDVQDVKDKSFVEIIEKKTGKYKKFPLNQKIRKLLSEYIDEDDEDDDPLFMTIYNNRLERTSAYRIINAACRKAGIKDNIGTHTLRKTFGYHHYKKFKDIALLQKIFNHYSPCVTLRYIGIDQEEINQSYINFVL